MIGALGARAIRRMQRKPEEDERADSRKQMLRNGLGRRAYAHGFAAGERRQIWRALCSSVYGGSHSGGKDGRQIWTSTSLLHVGERVAQRGYLPRRQFGGEILHERVAHACAGAVSQ